MKPDSELNLESRTYGSSPNAFPYLVRQVGASHVIVGTDYPFDGSAVPHSVLRQSAQVKRQKRIL